MRCPVEFCADSTAIVMPRGELSGSRARALGERLAALAGAGTRAFVVDLSGCDSADAFGVAVLAELACRRATCFSGLGRALATDFLHAGFPPTGGRFHPDVASALAQLRSEASTGPTWVRLAS